jgi:Ca-activated chloride channel family protein
MVQLSIRHGIMTPYTSFLADENVNLADRPANSARSFTVLREELSKSEGRSGVEQRDYKRQLKGAGAAESSPVGAPAAGGGGYGGALGGMRAGGIVSRKKLDQSGVDNLSLSRGSAVLSQDAEGEVRVLDSVRNLGQKTFFRKDKRWQDSTVTADQVKNATRVVQFSQEYFDLAASHGGILAKYLAFEEPVVVNLGNRTYQIDPAPAEAAPQE